MLKDILKKYKKIIFIYIFLGVGQIFASSMSVIYFQKLIDKIPSLKGIKGLLSVLIAYGVFMISDLIISYVNEYPGKILNEGIYQTIKILALKKVSVIDYKEYTNIGTGTLVKLIENGADAGTKIIFDFYLYIAKELIPTVVISLICIGAYDKNIAVAIVMGYILIFIITNLLLKYLYKIKEHVLTNEEFISKYFVRGIMEMLVFRVNKRFKHEIEKIKISANNVVKAKAKIVMLHELFFTLFALIVVVIKILIIIISVSRVSGTITVGTVVALISFVDKIYTPIAIFNVIFVDYKLDKLTYNRFLKFINSPEDKNLNSGRKIQIRNADISFRDIEFSYGDRKILRKVSFDIKGGSSVAIVGTSGAGKSTIIKIILGLLKPSSGDVLIDNEMLKDIKLNDYYSYISYVSQASPIFDGTIRENIVFNEKIEDTEIFKVLELVKLKELVTKFKAGLNTEIGERGIKLSGGEKQRLALARVFFQESKIVILDEPTSAMDSITEEIITNNLLKRLKGRTVIVIAHRLKTIKNTDNILVFENGDIKERGKFEELMRIEGSFKGLWERQVK
ncbi:ABC transporter ATP-binding protein [Clostridium hydrogenum]|uniref:ABC transporter ATP-binding protein n=1 Tax=Clostridium hydrogenum TaxID=2855764 RepID=UPI001F221CBC|nr:ABC transporter ATP-binding protein [Clostridium hydrogenum]